MAFSDRQPSGVAYWRTLKLFRFHWHRLFSLWLLNRYSGTGSQWAWPLLRPALFILLWHAARMVSRCSHLDLIRGSNVYLAIAEIPRSSSAESVFEAAAHSSGGVVGKMMMPQRHRCRFSRYPWYVTMHILRFRVFPCIAVASLLEFWCVTSVRVFP